MSASRLQSSRRTSTRDWRSELDKEYDRTSEYSQILRSSRSSRNPPHSSSTNASTVPPPTTVPSDYSYSGSNFNRSPESVVPSLVPSLRLNNIKDLAAESEGNTVVIVDAEEIEKYQKGARPKFPPLSKEPLPVAIDVNSYVASDLLKEVLNSISLVNSESFSGLEFLESLLQSKVELVR